MPLAIEAPVPIKTKTFFTPFIPIPGLTTGAAYAVGDAFGTIFGIEVPTSGVIQSAMLLDLSNQGATIEMWLFRTRFTPTADKIAFAPVASDLQNSSEGVISISTFYPASAKQVGEMDNVGKSYVAPQGILWCQCLTRGTPTVAAGSLPCIALRIMADN